MLKSKRSMFLIVLMTFVVLLSGCGSNTPEAKVDDLFKAVKSLDFESMGAIVSDEVKDSYNNELLEVDTDDGLKELDLESIEEVKLAKSNIKEIQKDLSYKVTNLEEDEKKAVATIDVDYVDASKLSIETVQEAFTEMMTEAFMKMGEMTEEMTEPTKEEENEEITKWITKMADKFNSKYKDFEKKTKSATGNITLELNEENSWIVTDIDEEILNAFVFNTIDGMDSMFSDFN